MAQLPTSAASKPRAIFRPEALHRHMQGRQRLVLPCYAAQSTGVLMWTLVIVLTAGGVLIGIARVPVVSPGTAVVDASGEHAVVFLAPETLPRLRPGQEVKLWLHADAAPETGQIESVEPRLVTPAEARRRYRLDDAVAVAITRPAAVATVRVQAIEGGEYAGSIVRAVVRTGVERVASRLLALGQRGGE